MTERDKIVALLEMLAEEGPTQEQIDKCGWTEREVRLMKAALGTAANSVKAGVHETFASLVEEARKAG